MGKEAKWLKPIKQAPFYGIHRHIRLSAIVHGVNVNGEMNVLDAEGNPIEGLYAIGNCAGNFFGSPDYPMDLPGFRWAAATPKATWWAALWLRNSGDRRLADLRRGKRRAIQRRQGVLRIVSPLPSLDRLLLRRLRAAPSWRVRPHIFSHAPRPTKASGLRFAPRPPDGARLVSRCPGVRSKTRRRFSGRQAESSLKTA